MNKFGTTPFDELACSNVNAAWAALTMEVLARLGLETVVISPGSRSGPLTVAAARNQKLESIPVLDERSAAFFALGIAKRSHKPVVLVCTSGSAVANYYPAVIEASASGTPLLILTADRPPELRDCASGQTMDQIKIFGGFVRYFAEIALPESTSDMFSYLRQTLVHAVDRTLHLDPGPVHLNFPFRAPLAPGTDGSSLVKAEMLEQAAAVMTRPFESIQRDVTVDQIGVEKLTSHSRGLIVVGDVNAYDAGEFFADTIHMLSEKLGWPVFSDVLNPLRSHAGENRHLVCHYDAFLRNLEECSEMTPSSVLQIGPLPTSKILRSWLKNTHAATFLLADRPMNIDSQHSFATVLHGEVHTLAEQISPQKVDSKWLESWRHIEQATAKALDKRFSGIDTMFEGKIAWLLSQYAPPSSFIFLASSMSVRYAEWFWRSGHQEYRFFANRGVNGIDGTMSTALGVAHAGRPTILLTGDLAFFHDSNALLTAKKLKGNLTVIVANNHGGGIFEHLPIAGWEGFEDYFATPQQASIELLCQSHEVPFQRICDWDGLMDAIARPPEGMCVLEIQTDRKMDCKTLQQLWSCSSSNPDVLS